MFVNLTEPPALEMCILPASKVRASPICLRLRRCTFSRSRFFTAPADYLVIIFMILEDTFHLCNPFSACDTSFDLGSCAASKQQQQQPKRPLQLDADVDCSRDSNGAIGGDERPAKVQTGALAGVARMRRGDGWGDRTGTKEQTGASGEMGQGHKQAALGHCEALACQRDAPRSDDARGRGRGGHGWVKQNVSPLLPLAFSNPARSAALVACLVPFPSVISTRTLFSLLLSPFDLNPTFPRLSCFSFLFAIRLLEPPSPILSPPPSPPPSPIPSYPPLSPVPPHHESPFRVGGGARVGAEGGRGGNCAVPPVPLLKGGTVRSRGSGGGGIVTKNRLGDKAELGGTRKVEEEGRVAEADEARGSTRKEAELVQGGRAKGKRRAVLEVERPSRKQIPRRVQASPLRSDPTRLEDAPWLLEPSSWVIYR
ncbi:unnamed protein product [Closterium sp. Naga37s-1]|nr:unnamed protein product [Closterium sp. Naga37s-1]